jgi:tRNA(Arg) A34 adenosine deaminase TadA
MSAGGETTRRDFLLKAAGAAGSAGLVTLPTPASAQGRIPALPADIEGDAVLARQWQKPLAEVATVDSSDLDIAVPELSTESVKERHRIYSLLLMALVQRFWNGNNNGPLGVYPLRQKQKEPGQDPNAVFFRYRGDMIKDPDRFRINWDRYLGHNIACLAVDGNGEIIDFEFNHNNIFRSSAEHAEARMVRRLFSLADIFDNWKTGTPIRGRSRAFSLLEVTLYTSLESCAQCSGVMSLGRVRQVVYLQNDPGAYRIGNIMYKLAGRDPNDHTVPLAPIPVPASHIGLSQLQDLNSAYRRFRTSLAEAEKRNDSAKAYFIPPDGGAADYASSITSFLCTDEAYSIFANGAALLDTVQLKYPGNRYPHKDKSLTNKECLSEAQRFFKYADVEGFRGSPHKP